jgi:hypothetical protein
LNLYQRNAPVDMRAVVIFFSSKVSPSYLTTSFWIYDRDLNEHLRRLQQQAESRRRVAVMEMMRQRAAEAAGTNS